jgi:hypothetical protein
MRSGGYCTTAPEQHYASGSDVVQKIRFDQALLLVKS